MLLVGRGREFLGIHEDIFSERSSCLLILLSTTFFIKNFYQNSVLKMFTTIQGQVIIFELEVSGDG